MPTGNDVQATNSRNRQIENEKVKVGSSKSNVKTNTRMKTKEYTIQTDQGKVTKVTQVQDHYSNENMEDDLNADRYIGFSNTSIKKVDMSGLRRTQPVQDSSVTLHSKTALQITMAMNFERKLDYISWWLETICENGIEHLLSELIKRSGTYQISFINNIINSATVRYDSRYLRKLSRLKIKGVDEQPQPSLAKPEQLVKKGAQNQQQAGVQNPQISSQMMLGRNVVPRQLLTDTHFLKCDGLEMPGKTLPSEKKQEIMKNRATAEVVNKKWKHIAEDPSPLTKFSLALQKRHMQQNGDINVTESLVLDWYLYATPVQKTDILTQMFMKIDPKFFPVLYRAINERQYRNFLTRDVPMKCILLILFYLDDASLKSLSMVCHEYYYLINSDRLWQVERIYNNDAMFEHRDDDAVPRRHALANKQTAASRIHRQMDDLKQFSSIYRKLLTAHNLTDGRYEHFTLTGHTGKVVAIAAHPEGVAIASGSTDTTIRIWDVVVGKCIRVLRGHNAGVWGIAFWNDSFLISTAYDSQWKMWNYTTGVCLRTVSHCHDSSPIWCMKIVDNCLLTAGGDQKIVAWSIANGNLQRTFIGHKHAIYALDASAQLNIVLTGSADRTAKIWNFATAGSLKTITLKSDVSVTAVSIDGHYFVMASGLIFRLYKLPDDPVTMLKENTVLPYLQFERYHTRRIESIYLKLNTSDFGGWSSKCNETSSNSKSPNPAKSRQGVIKAKPNQEKAVEEEKSTTVDTIKSDTPSDEAFRDTFKDLQGLIMVAANDGHVSFWQIDRIARPSQDFYPHKGEAVNRVHFDLRRLISAGNDRTIVVHDFFVENQKRSRRKHKSKLN